MNEDKTILQAKRLEVFLRNERASLGEVAREMVTEDVSAVVVVDEHGWLTGIVTRTDLIRAYCEHEDWAALPVSDFMSRDVVTVSPNDRLSEAACLLVNHQIHRVVVVQEIEGHLKPVGVLAAADLIYHILKSE